MGYNLLQQVRQALRQKYAPSLNAYEHQVRGRFISLGNVVRHALESALEGGVTENDERLRHKKTNRPAPIRPPKVCFGFAFPWRPHWTALKDFCRYAVCVDRKSVV